jgi:hypothetical protein
MAIFNTVYGGEWKRHPWSNTLIYYDFETASGSSVPNLWTLWNSYDGVATWVTFQTLSSWKKVAEITSNSRSNWIVTSSTTSVPTNFTIWAWIKGSSSSRSGVFWIDDWNANSYTRIEFNADGWSSNIQCYNGSWVIYWQSSTSVLDWSWHLVCWSYDWTSVFYKDTTALSPSYWHWSASTQAVATWKISVWHTWYAARDWSFVWQIWCFWLENKWWSLDELTKYYNSTKANYS